MKITYLDLRVDAESFPVRSPVSVIKVAALLRPGTQRLSASNTLLLPRNAKGTPDTD